MGNASSKLTRFFRNPAQLASFEHVIVPDIVARRTDAGRPILRLWSVGCSTGEEPFTLAILLSEILPAHVPFEVVALDRSPEALQVAKRGLYPAAKNEVPSRLLERYFNFTPGGWVVSDSLRRRVRFDLRPVQETTEHDTYDIVSCRNVLTYAEASERARIAARIWDAMASYAYLLVGGSESLFGVDDRFEYLPNEWSFAYRKRAGKPPAMGSRSSSR